MKLAILKNDFDEGYKNWSSACSKLNIEYDIIELTSAEWLSQVMSYSYSCYLTCPPGREQHYKTMYDERVFIIEKVLGKYTYPNYQEISIHENKKYLSYWLKANKIPHPKTFVFYEKREAVDFVCKAKLPLVGKMNIGASGKGVTVHRNMSSVRGYIEKAFSLGLRQSWGPNVKMGGYGKRIKSVLKNPSIILRKLKIYKKNYDATQKGFVILQEYIEHNYEWRIVKIGDSYFGHKKIKHGDKASGTKGINYDIPPVVLLDFVYDLCRKFHFNSMAVDLFEDGRGGFLVNEMQCIFGHVQNYICEKEGKPGRFVRKNDGWEFEEGFFNSNLSYDLRLMHAISLIG